MAARRSLCLPHVRQTLAGSTKVLGRDEAAKKPPEWAVVASRARGSAMQAETETVCMESDEKVAYFFVSAAIIEEK